MHCFIEYKKKMLNWVTFSIQYISILQNVPFHDLLQLSESTFSAQSIQWYVCDWEDEKVTPIQ